VLLVELWYVGAPANEADAQGRLGDDHVPRPARSWAVAIATARDHIRFYEVPESSGPLRQLNCPAISALVDTTDEGTDPLASVVVCTHNGSRTLTLALASLSAQNFEHGSYEVVLVDDASTDETPQIAAASDARVVRRERSSGLAAARNAGLAAARGQFVAFTDDDCEASPDWLQQLITPLLDDSSLAGVTGFTSVGSNDSIPFRFLGYRNPLRPLPISLLDSTNPLARLRTYLREDAGPRPAVAQHSHVYALVGANMALRRKLLDDVGGFDEAMVQSEDEDLSRRIHRHLDGATFLYDERAHVAHHYRPGFADTVKRGRTYGRGSALIKRQSREFPALFPFPLLTAAIFLATLLVSPRRIALAALAPLAFYGGWWPTILRRRQPEALLYPYMQLLQESAQLWGQFQYYRRPLP
jgi:glycosyltransferase involved in cell wall biosynthesis